ncbi:MAG: 3-oxoacyl-ACP synthase, partial [Acidimicrobiia bacterium]|nr:3-oxoacyl-ACP synthase [Acidimicrobiia bacterium]
SVLFGDGAGAVLLESVDQDEPVGLLASDLGMAGESAELLCTPGRGTAGDVGEPDPSTMGVRMEGAEVFRQAVTMMGEASANVIKQAGLTLDDVDILIPHQANVRIIDATARRLKLDPARVFVNIASYGNTSAATIPIALTEALEEGRISAGANIVFAAFGGGLSWGAALVRWGTRIEPVGTTDADLPASTRTALEIIEPNLEFYGRPEMPS